MSADPDDGFEPLLEFIRTARGFDFTSYKRPSLRRRVTRRLEALGLQTFEAYQDHLEVHPDEFPKLFDTVLINVTTFFREPASWDFLARQVIPDILARKDPDAPIRVWSAGCAGGQEAYTLAMVLSEALGDDDFRRRVKVYATDLDEDALAEARRGSYTPKQVEDVPQEYLARYFEDQGTRYQFRPDLRRMIIFGRHDVTTDAPISRLDLLVCRNTLMYFIAETQRRVAARFHYALREGAGYLFVGKAETLPGHGDLFEQVDPRHRIYRRAEEVGARLALAQAVVSEPDPRSAEAIRHRALEEAPVAQVVVDGAGMLAFANAQARAAFRLRREDLGRPFRDLELSFRPVELRSRIEQAVAERGEVRVSGVERPLPDGGVEHLEVSVTPLLRDGAGPLGTSITFFDVSEVVHLKEQAHRSDQELETANEELQSTNEELETSNEELQSTNEELETTNEELQSTNEELETLNEELHSTNEELGAMNEELQRRTVELDRLNTFMGSILASVSVGVVVVDEDIHIEVWNERAEDLWGLRADEVRGRSLLVLDIGLPVSMLAAPIRACLAGSEGEQLVLRGHNRRGREIDCRVFITPLERNDHGHDGAVLLMEELP
jgi:two-component system, chemotaxis family, CheB/CheR fusion protein